MGINLSLGGGGGGCSPQNFYKYEVLYERF